MKSELVKPTHLARRAVVYIRQSTPHQVVSNQESLRLQYGLRQRARELGWREADIDVIDSDLGLSAASAAQRTGFKELVGRVGLKEVGLILSIDVTRLARNCSDWYPLLDICGLHGCLIADRDGVYDPGSANGRLLLGLKGTISELELHTIRSRLTAGLVAKAERGELALTLPIGLVRDPSGAVVKDPNLEVQERLALLFCNHLRSHQGLSACQYLRAHRIDATVAQAFLTALAPAEIDALSRARRAQQQSDKAMRKSAEQQLERRRYEAALAERQFNRVDPDNRLVASELERRWESALKEVRAAEEALARAASPQAIAPVAVSKALNDNVIRLSGRLPEIWADPTTTDAKRKALLRCLVEKVILDRGEHDVARVRIVWRGGAVSEIAVKMRVGSVANLTRGAEMRERVIELARTKMHDDEIAAVLTSEGHRSPNCADKVLPITVQRIRLRAGLKGHVEQRTRWRHAADLLSAHELAGVLGIPVNWLYVQIRQGRLLIDRHPAGAHLFANTPSVI